MPTYSSITPLDSLSTSTDLEPKAQDTHTATVDHISTCPRCYREVEFLILRKNPRDENGDVNMLLYIILGLLLIMLLRKP